MENQEPTALEIAMAKNYTPMQASSFLGIMGQLEGKFVSTTAVHYLALLALDGNDRNYENIPLIANDKSAISKLREKAHECNLISAEGNVTKPVRDVLQNFLLGKADYKMDFEAVEKILQETAQNKSVSNRQL